MASNLTPAKRPLERHQFDSNGRGKWKKTVRGHANHNQPKGQGKTTVFRILCPESKCGGLIGKGGSVVAKIRQETGARIKLDDPVFGCTERVVTIIAAGKDVTVTRDPNMDISRNEQNKDEGIDSEQGKEDGPDSEQNKEEMINGVQGEEEGLNIGQNKEEGDSGELTKEDTCTEDNKVDSAVEQKEEGYNEEKKGSETEGADASAVTTNEEPNSEDREQKDGCATVEDVKFDQSLPAAVKALLLVFDRIVSVEDSSGADGPVEDSVNISTRLMIFSSQVHIFGKGGSLIKQMSVDSGSQIQILSREQIPPCASSQDDVVQINGTTVDAVRKALQLVGQQLYENPPLHVSSQKLEPLPKFDFSTQGPSFFPDFHPNKGPHLNFPEPTMSGHPQMHPQSLTFRILCSSQKVGGVIGKSGVVVKAIQNDTGCDIKILEIPSEPDDRIIAISGPALPNERLSPAQDAVLQVQRRLAGKEDPAACKVLVSSYQTGCLLGKGGSIISEMRKISKAWIRVIPRDSLPQGLPDGDEVVQINGEPEAVLEALVQVTARLRNHHFAKNPNILSGFTPLEPAPSGVHSHFHTFQRDAVRSFEERSTYAHGMHGPSLPLGPERAPWAAPGLRDIGPLSIPDFSGGLHRKIGALSGPTQSISKISAEVVVPRLLVPALYGDDGGCLRRIREMSEAKITITEPRPEATETVILISGLPDQTYAAQSLLQAFVLCEKGSQ